MVETRLDRVYVNQQFLDIFPFFIEEHVVNARFNHLLIIAHVRMIKKSKNKRRKMFKFENM